MENEILIAHARMQKTFEVLLDLGFAMPFKIGVIVDGKWMEVGIVDTPLDPI